MPAFWSSLSRSWDSRIAFIQIIITIMIIISRYLFSLPWTFFIVNENAIRQDKRITARERAWVKKSQKKKKTFQCRHRRRDLFYSVIKYLNFINISYNPRHPTWLRRSECVKNQIIIVTARLSQQQCERYQSRRVEWNEKFVDKCQKMKALLTIFFLLKIFLVPNFHLILPQYLSLSHMLLLW